MKRFNSCLSVFLPTVIALSCMNQVAQGQSQPKLESPSAVDLSELQESFSPSQDLPPILEAPAQPRLDGGQATRGGEPDPDIELFTDQGEPVIIKPMSPEDLQLAPGQEAFQDSVPQEAVVEPDQPWLPNVEQAPELSGARPAPELRRYRANPVPSNPRTRTRPRLGVAGELVQGWGFQVVHVLPGSAAARMQLEPGDVILNINGQCVSSLEAIEQQLLRSVGKFAGQGVIKIDNVRGRTHCGASSKRYLWLKFQL